VPDPRRGGARGKGGSAEGAEGERWGARYFVPAPLPGSVRGTRSIPASGGGVETVCLVLHGGWVCACVGMCVHTTRGRGKKEECALFSLAETPFPQPAVCCAHGALRLHLGPINTIPAGQAYNGQPPPLCGCRIASQSSPFLLIWPAQRSLSAARSASSSSTTPPCLHSSPPAARPPRRGGRPPWPTRPPPQPHPRSQSHPRTRRGWRRRTGSTRPRSMPPPPPRPPP